MSFTIRPLATGLPRFGSRVLLANAARRAPLTSARGYTTANGSTKKSSNNTLLFLGLAALGGAGGYYYHTSQQGVKVLDSNKKKNIDYNQVYKDIAEILEDNDYDDGSYGPVLFTLYTMSDGYHFQQYSESSYEHTEYTSNRFEHPPPYPGTTTTTTTSYSYSSSGAPEPSGGMVAAGDDEDDNTLKDQEDDDQLFLKVNPKYENKKVDFKLSHCSGRKRALLIGINYFNTPNQLDGCINDVHNIKNFLTTLWGFQEQDMVILTDDQQESRFIPTRANIIAAMKWLVSDAQEDDSFFFHYSGHGGYLPDDDGDEDDGYDETIFPVDHENYDDTTGQIRDDEMHDLLVKPLPEGCRLTAIYDSCHSGTVLDLPYTYSTKGTLKEQNMFKHAGKGLLEVGLAYATGDREAALTSLIGLGQSLLKARNTQEENRETNSSLADVIMFSGCKDDQTSADAQEAGKATGAMSYAFTTTLRDNPNQTYNQLLNNVRDILRDRYAQRPQLSSSHPLDVNAQFIC